MTDLLSDEAYLKSVLREGAIEANDIAEENIFNYKKLMGLLL